MNNKYIRYVRTIYRYDKLFSWSTFRAFSSSIARQQHKLIYLFFRKSWKATQRPWSRNVTSHWGDYFTAGQFLQLAIVNVKASQQSVLMFNLTLLWSMKPVPWFERSSQNFYQNHKIYSIHAIFYSLASITGSNAFLHLVIIV